MGRENFGDKTTVLWKDRKRWCGKPWSFTRYYLVQKEGSWTKLFTSTGFLSVHQEEVNLYRVYDISVFVSFTNRIFKTGTIVLHCNINNMPKIKLVRVKNPYKVRDTIACLIEKDRKRKGYRIGEYAMGASN